MLNGNDKMWGRQDLVASRYFCVNTQKFFELVGDFINPWKDENGIQYIGVEQFLLDEKAIES